MAHYPYGYDQGYGQGPYQYGHQGYGQHPYANGQHMAPFYNQQTPGYQAMNGNHYPQHQSGYPAKKHKTNSAHSGFPTSFPGHSYGPQPYPQMSYPQQPGIPPPPPPGWIPPPPPGWRAPVLPISPVHQGYQGFPSHSPAHGQYNQPPYNAYSHVSKSPTSYQNHAQHWQQNHNLTKFPRSKQWIRPPDQPTSIIPPAVPAYNAGCSRPPPSVASLRPLDPAPPKPSVPPPASPSSVESGVVNEHADDYNESEDWEWDNYWYEEGEDVNESLSLGEIVWHPGVRTGRAIPAVYDDAEQWCESMPTPFPDHGVETVSRYTFRDDIEQSCRPIYNTAGWSEVKDDPVFVQFPDDATLITIDEVVFNRNRPAVSTELDLDDEEGEIPTSKANYQWHLPEDVEETLHYNFQTPPAKRSTDSASSLLRSASTEDHETSFHTPKMINDIADVEEEVEDEEPYSPPPVNHVASTAKFPEVIRREDIESERVCIPSVRTEKHGEIIHLAEATQDIKPIPSIPSMPSITESKVRPKQHTPTKDLKLDIKPQPPMEHKLPPKPEVNAYRPSTLPPKPPEYERNEAQEELLARLGVTGAPKPILGAPRPAYTSAPEKSLGDKQSSQTTTAIESAPIPPPPPPPMPPPVVVESAGTTEDDNPWRSAPDGLQGSPRSETSQHTLAGSDFHMEEEECNREPKADANKADSPKEVVKTTSRKRRTGSDVKQEDTKRRQRDDTLSRLRPRQPKVDAVYNRRW